MCNLIITEIWCVFILRALDCKARSRELERACNSIFFSHIVRCEIFFYLNSFIYWFTDNTSAECCRDINSLAIICSIYEPNRNSKNLVSSNDNDNALCYLFARFSVASKLMTNKMMLLASENQSHKFVFVCLVGHHTNIF